MEMLPTLDEIRTKTEADAVTVELQGPFVRVEAIWFDDDGETESAASMIYARSSLDKELINLVDDFVTQTVDVREFAEMEVEGHA